MDQNIDKLEFIKRLVKGNFLNMIKSRDIASLNELKSNPGLLGNILVSIGAGEKIMESPAHRERLEEILKEIINGLIEELPNGRDDSGYSIEFEDNSLKVRFEGWMTQDDYKIEINNDKDYSIYIKKSRGTSGYRSKKIVGFVDKREIISYQTSWNFLEQHESGEKTLLDENCFAIESLLVDKCVKDKVETKSTLKLTRKGLKITSSDKNSKPIRWNGNPICLNSKDESAKENFRNIARTIRKYPNSKQYYEELFGMSFDELLKEDKVD